MKLNSKGYEITKNSNIHAYSYKIKEKLILFSKESKEEINSKDALERGDISMNLCTHDVRPGYNSE